MNFKNFHDKKGVDSAFDPVNIIVQMVANSQSSVFLNLLNFKKSVNIAWSKMEIKIYIDFS